MAGVWSVILEAAEVLVWSATKLDVTAVFSSITSMEILEHDPTSVQPKSTDFC